MKILVLFVLVLSSSVGFARRDIDLRSNAAIDIKVAEDVVSLLVHYPGVRLSKICGIELRTSHPVGWRVLYPLMKEFRVRYTFFEDVLRMKIKSQSIVFELADSAYVDGITITAPVGQTVDEVAAQFLGGHSLTASAVSCDRL